MALQTTGAISIDNIRTELGQAQANSSLRALSALASKSSPDAMSDFYGFSASTEFTFYGADGGSGYEQWEQGCGEANYPISLYSSSTSLAVGVILYKGSDLQNVQNGEDLWWKSFGEGDNIYQIKSNGAIQSIQACP